MVVGGVAVRDPVERDQALLAFIKCHLTSVTRWNVLRALAHCPGDWRDASALADAIHAPIDAVRVALDDLAGEGVIQRRLGSGSAAYRLDSADPTARVVGRLLDEARHNQRLRQMIVARVLGRGAAGASVSSR